MEMTGAILLLIGSIVFLISALGIIRMPDVYNRIQTGTKATTMGIIFVMVGLSFLHPQWSAKLVILILFIILTNPVSSHVVARGAHFSKVKKSDKTVADKLEEREGEEI